MKISNRIDGSIYGAILASRPSSSLCLSLSPSSTALLQIHAARVRSRRCIAVSKKLPNGFRPSLPSTPKKTPRDPSHLAPPRLLSAAIARPGTRTPSLSYFTSHYASHRNQSHVAAPAIEEDLDQQPKIIPPKVELLRFVDQYDDTSVEEHLEYLRDPYMRRYAPAEGPEITVSNRKEDVSLQSFDEKTRWDSEEIEAVRNLRAAVLTKLRRPPRMDLDTIYGLYQALPEPRIGYLTYRLRHQLLAVLAMAERRNAKSMLRYFAVVADVKQSGFSLTRGEWNSAMSFASRYVGITTEVETEAALHLWREMELVAGVKGNGVTFNILFDVASKAGKFKLAEMIYQEMTTRGFKFNRYHHVSLIHFFGLKQDTGGVRAAYKEMVESGEIVDSIVLNCIISSFLRCGEEESAERVYERMKASNKNLNALPYRNYSLQKSITKVLMMFAKVGRAHPDMRSSFQESALCSPGLDTYRILINYYGQKRGDLAKVAQLLDEMKLFRVPLHGAIFLALFKSFHVYAGPGSDWSAQRLGSVWEAFLEAFDSGAEGLHISTWLAMAVLRAFSQYSSRDEILDVYECLRSRWDLDVASSQFMLDYLDKILQRSGSRVQRKGIAMGLRS